MDLLVPLSDHGGELARMPGQARAAEEAGFGVSVSERQSDPMLQLTLAASATSTVTLLTNVVIAFARSPMTLAVQATGVQEYSAGRLVLGLGSQIKPHIERRFSMPWSEPAERMAEYVQALYAIWESWATGERLDFRGRFYRHTLMIPEFTPVISRPRPEVLVAAVGPRMTEAAGRVADGVIVHPFTTPAFLREMTLPALRRGATEAGRSIDEVATAGTVFVISGRTDEELARSRELVRARIAFYGSTPAYLPVLALHGWADLGRELNTMSKTRDPQRWSRMTRLVPDDVLHAFAVEGPPDVAGRAAALRYGGLLRRLIVNPDGFDDPAVLFAVMSAIQAEVQRGEELPTGS
jgi:probable F420-dependent oxidoreductase